MLRRGHHRNAFTLLEMLLVATLLVVLAALSWPSIRSGYRGVKVDAGVDTVREALAMARLRATEDGRPYRVAIRPGQPNVRVAPEQSDFWNGLNPTEADPLTGITPFILEKELPKDLRVYVMGNNMPTPELDGVASRDVTPSEWQTAVVFFPDGTAHKDVNILVRFNGFKLGAVLSVRALTGARSARRATDGDMP